VEIVNGAVIPATHLAAQLEWLSHAVKGFGFDFGIWLTVLKDGYAVK
jgi:hypothetical protein